MYMYSLGLSHRHNTIILYMYTGLNARHNFNLKACATTMGLRTLNVNKPQAIPMGTMYLCTRTEAIIL